jgi:DNA-binding NtrC family response regulator
VRQDPLATLLIVDDEPSIRNSMAQVLTEIGYLVRSAWSRRKSTVFLYSFRT